MEKKPTVELSSVTCNDCGGQEFLIYLENRTNGQTKLTVVCASKECRKAKRKQLGVPEDQFIIWEQFDITGQGRDALDDYEAGDVN